MSSTDKDLNLEPITGAPGAHPVGTGVGAAAGGATGAAVGSVAGPIGTAVGAVIGAVVGGLAGKSVAETVDPTAEEAYWRESYTREPYYRDGHTYDDYAPAYGLGIGSLVADKYRDRSFDDIEGSLAEEWDISRGIRASTGRKPAPPRVPPGRARSAIAARCKRARPALSARAVPTRRSSRADAAKAGSGPARPAPAVRR